MLLTVFITNFKILKMAYKALSRSTSIVLSHPTLHPNHTRIFLGPQVEQAPFYTLTLSAPLPYFIPNFCSSFISREKCNFLRESILDLSPKAEMPISLGNLDFSFRTPSTNVLTIILKIWDYKFLESRNHVCAVPYSFIPCIYTVPSTYQDLNK